MNAKKYLAKLRSRSYKLRGSNPQELLASEIYEYFKKPKNFYPLVRKMINDKGAQFVREEFEHIKKNRAARDKKTLFLWRILNAKIQFNE